MYQSTYQLYYWLSLSCVSVENRSRCGWQSAPMSCGSMVHNLLLRWQITDTWPTLWPVTLVQTLKLNVSAIIGSLLGMKDMASDISRGSRSREIQVNPKNPTK